MAVVGGFLDLRMVTGTLSRVTNHCSEALMSSVIIWALEVLSDVFICGRSFLKWKFLLWFSQWFCVLAFFGYRKICFSFAILFETSVVSCSNISPNNYISVFIYSQAYFYKPLTFLPQKTFSWIFMLLFLWKINSYGDHMLSTSWKDHGRGL